jgi:N-acetylmuramoyl-L-alanine amidase
VNLSLKERANVARDNGADLFLSIHCNGFNGVARGVEAFVRPVDAGNINHADDREFALRVQGAVLAAIRAHDQQTPDRGVKDMKLGVLTDAHLGNTPGNARCRACLLELEFIDVPAVDRLLNTDAGAARVRADVANAIRDAIIASLP